MNTEAYQTYLHQRGFTDQTITGYRCMVARFLHDFPQAPEAHYQDLLAFIGKRSRQYPQTSTASHHLSAIKSYYDYLIASGQRQSGHPCKHLNLKGHSPKSEILPTQLFSREELETLLNAREESYEKMRQRNQALLSLMIYQGLTQSELVRLERTHLDLDNGTLFIKASRSLKQRKLELHPKQYRLLDRYIRKGRSQLKLGSNATALFLNYRGNPITTDDVKYLLETLRPFYLDRKLNNKTIRQSVIYHWVNVEKISVADVQLMAGFSLPSTVVRFQQETIEERREKMNKFWPLG